MEKKEKLTTERQKKDFWNICLLLGLYSLQGVPRGLGVSIPLLLQNRGATYSDQAQFDLSTFPCALKLLWAPIIDSIYVRRFGKRKTWLIPIQYLIGISLLFTSWHIEDWLGSEGGKRKPNILPLTLMFSLLNVLQTTLDMIVDGWSISLLQRENVGYQAYCNVVGYGIGGFFSVVVLTELNSKEFCNNWLRETPKSTGIVSVSDFIFFCSVMFTGITTLILIFKKDNSITSDMVSNQMSIRTKLLRSYQILWDILSIKPVIMLCCILLTCKVGLGPLEVFQLKLLDAGVSRDKLVLISIPLVPLHATLPLLLKDYLVGVRCINSFIQCLMFMNVILVICGALVYVTPLMKVHGELPGYYFGLLFVIYGLQDTVMFMIAVSFLAFAARISDPSCGSTYMTLLTMVKDLGKQWPATLSLWLVDIITLRTCPSMKTDGPSLLMSDSLNMCQTIIDGFYIEIILSIMFSILWIQCGGKKTMLKLQNWNESSWLVKKRIHNSENELLLWSE